VLGIIAFGFWQAEQRKQEEVASAQRKQEEAVRIEQSKPQLPIDVGYRKAVMGPGLVVQLKNNSERDLAVLMTVENPTTNQEKTFRVDVSPKEVSEVGHLEGWTFASGDSIKVIHADYKPWQGKLP
jgi:hypothetical protein